MEEKDDLKNLLEASRHGVPATIFLHELAEKRGWSAATIGRKARAIWFNALKDEAARAESGVVKLNAKTWLVVAAEKAVDFLVSKIGDYSGIPKGATAEYVFYELKRVRLKSLCDWAEKSKYKLGMSYTAFARLSDDQRAEWGIEPRGSDLILVDVPVFREKLKSVLKVFS